MSLIMIALHPYFLLAEADQRATNKDTEKIISEEFQKVFKLNSNVILCISGTVVDDYDLFSEFLEYCEDNVRLRKKPSLNNDQTLLNVCNSVNTRFLELDVNRPSGKPRQLHCFVCGHDQTSFVVFTYSINDGKKEVPQVIRPYPDINKIASEFAGSLELDRHKANFLTALKDNAITVQNIKRAFVRTLDAGIRFDKSINNSPMFEEMVLLDFIR